MCSMTSRLSEGNYSRQRINVKQAYICSKRQWSLCHGCAPRQAPPSSTSPGRIDSISSSSAYLKLSIDFRTQPRPTHLAYAFAFWDVEPVKVPLLLALDYSTVQ